MFAVDYPIVIFFVAVVLLFVVLFFIWLFSKEDIGGYGAISGAQADLMMIRGRAGLVRARTGLVNTARGLAKSYGETIARLQHAQHGSRESGRAKSGAATGIWGRCCRRSKN